MNPVASPLSHPTLSTLRNHLPLPSSIIDLLTPSMHWTGDRAKIFHALFTNGLITPNGMLTPKGHFQFPLLSQEMRKKFLDILNQSYPVTIGKKTIKLRALQFIGDSPSHFISDFVTKVLFEDPDYMGIIFENWGLDQVYEEYCKGKTFIRESGFIDIRIKTKFKNPQDLKSSFLQVLKEVQFDIEDVKSVEKLFNVVATNVSDAIFYQIQIPGSPIRIMWTMHLARECLFSVDDLAIPVQDLLSSRGACVPMSLMNHKEQSIVDILLGILRAQNTESIGPKSPHWLVWYTTQGIYPALFSEEAALAAKLLNFPGFFLNELTKWAKSRHLRDLEKWTLCFNGLLYLDKARATQEVLTKPEKEFTFATLFHALQRKPNEFLALIEPIAYLAARMGSKAVSITHSYFQDPAIEVRLGDFSFIKWPLNFFEAPDGVSLANYPIEELIGSWIGDKSFCRLLPSDYQKGLELCKKQDPFSVLLGLIYLAQFAQEKEKEVFILFLTNYTKALEVKNSFCVQWLLQTYETLFRREIPDIHSVEWAKFLLEIRERVPEAEESIFSLWKVSVARNPQILDLLPSLVQNSPSFVKRTLLFIRQDEKLGSLYEKFLLSCTLEKWPRNSEWPLFLEAVWSKKVQSSPVLSKESYQAFYKVVGENIKNGSITGFNSLSIPFFSHFLKACAAQETLPSQVVTFIIEQSEKIPKDDLPKEELADLMPKLFAASSEPAPLFSLAARKTIAAKNLDKAVLEAKILSSKSKLEEHVLLYWIEFLVADKTPLTKETFELIKHLIDSSKTFSWRSLKKDILGELVEEIDKESFLTPALARFVFQFFTDNEKSCRALFTKFLPKLLVSLENLLPFFNSVERLKIPLDSLSKEQISIALKKIETASLQEKTKTYWVAELVKLLDDPTHVLEGLCKNSPAFVKEILQRVQSKNCIDICYRFLSQLPSPTKNQQELLDFLKTQIDFNHQLSLASTQGLNKLVLETIKEKGAEKAWAALSSFFDKNETALNDFYGSCKSPFSRELTNFLFLSADTKRPPSFKGILSQLIPTIPPSTVAVKLIEAYGISLEPISKSISSWINFIQNSPDLKNDERISTYFLIAHLRLSPRTFSFDCIVTLSMESQKSFVDLLKKEKDLLFLLPDCLLAITAAKPRDASFIDYLAPLWNSCFAKNDNPTEQQKEAFCYLVSQLIQKEDIEEIWKKFTFSKKIKITLLPQIINACIPFYESHLKTSMQLQKFLNFLEKAGKFGPLLSPLLPALLSIGAPLDTKEKLSIIVFIESQKIPIEKETIAEFWFKTLSASLDNLPIKKKKELYLHASKIRFSQRSAKDVLSILHALFKEEKADDISEQWIEDFFSLQEKEMEETALLLIDKQEKMISVAKRKKILTDFYLKRVPINRDLILQSFLNFQSMLSIKNQITEFSESIEYILFLKNETKSEDLKSRSRHICAEAMDSMLNWGDQNLQKGLNESNSEKVRVEGITNALSVANSVLKFVQMDIRFFAGYDSIFINLTYLIGHVKREALEPFWNALMQVPEIAQNQKLVKRLLEDTMVFESGVNNPFILTLLEFASHQGFIGKNAHHETALRFLYPLFSNSSSFCNNIHDQMSKKVFQTMWNCFEALNLRTHNPFYQSRNVLIKDESLDFLVKSGHLVYTYDSKLESQEEGAAELAHSRALIVGTADALLISRIGTIELNIIHVLFLQKNYGLALNRLADFLTARQTLSTWKQIGPLFNTMIQNFSAFSKEDSSNYISFYLTCLLKLVTTCTLRDVPKLDYIKAIEGLLDDVHPFLQQWEKTNPASYGIMRVAEPRLINSDELPIYIGLLALRGKSCQLEWRRLEKIFECLAKIPLELSQKCADEMIATFCENKTSASLKNCDPLSLYRIQSNHYLRLVEHYSSHKQSANQDYDLSKCITKFLTSFASEFREIAASSPHDQLVEILTTISKLLVRSGDFLFFDSDDLFRGFENLVSQISQLSSYKTKKTVPHAKPWTLEGELELQLLLFQPFFEGCNGGMRANRTYFIEAALGLLEKHKKYAKFKGWNKVKEDFENLNKQIKSELASIFN